MMFLESTTAAANMFTEAHISTITTNFTTAIGNVIQVFVDLLPLFAIATGLGFGIYFIKNQFGRVRRGK